jgi:UDP-2,4-diacetamido-2,4,6-trideoxy-beta-L-altropyranose hydrolase
LPERRVLEIADRMVVTTGAGDVSDTAGLLAAAAKQGFSGRSTRVVLGPYSRKTTPTSVDPVVAPASLLDELLQADICVTAGGQTLLEAAAVGVPTVGVVLAENQRSQLEGLARLGAVVMVDGSDPEEAMRAVHDLDRSVDRRRVLSTRAQAIVDGYGAFRVAFRIASLLSQGR